MARGTRTGVEEYTINLLSHLLPLKPEINYKLFYNAFNKVKLDYHWLDLNNVSLKDFRIPNRLFFGLAKYFNQPKIDKLLKNTDIYFNPHFFVAPLTKKCKKVITFHDLSFEHYPEFFSWRKRGWQKVLMNTKKEAEKADRIIAVSNSTKDDLVNLYGIDERKVKVIHSGVGEQFRVIKDKEKLNEIREKYRLPNKFILYFGTIEPRKNLIGLIKAFESLKDKEVKLVMAGANGWLYEDILKTAQRSKRNQDIFFTGFVDERDKPGLYNLAQTFVYPSFFEGFGFPPLEAMACGISTVVSVNSSLPEVVGDAGIMVNPKNIDELSWAMDVSLNNSDLRNELIKKGLERAPGFSWQNCARETLSIFS